MIRFAGALALSLVLAGCSDPVALPTFDGGNQAQYSVPSASASAPAEVSAPESISIPKIGAESTLEHVGLINGEIDIPPATQPEQAAWWDGTPRPGEVGPAVILGHVDGEIDGRAGQPGVFFKLHTLTAGDVVDIAREDGSTVRFEIYKVERVAKDEFPNDRVYGNTSGPELRLITCGGVFNRSAGHYVDNVIAYARQAS
jgi:sortase (surface protein transpeptidase)